MIRSWMVASSAGPGSQKRVVTAEAEYVVLPDRENWAAALMPANSRSWAERDAEVLRLVVWVMERLVCVVVVICERGGLGRTARGRCGVKGSDRRLPRLIDELGG